MSGNSGRERVETVRSPRTAALKFVTSDGKNTLSVNQWLDAGPPNGEKPEASFRTYVSICPLLDNDACSIAAISLTILSSPILLTCLHRRSRIQRTVVKNFKLRKQASRAESLRPGSRSLYVMTSISRIQAQVGKGTM